MSHPSQLSLEALLADCTTQRTRGSGPGGQHRNKVETAIVITHTPTGIRGEASERRSQEQNRAMAIFRLRLKLAVEVRHTANESPSTLWQSRCRAGKVSVNDQHNDYPALLAEALDQLVEFAWQPSDAADRLGVSSSQLIKLCKQHPPAFRLVNQQREALGLKTLS
ncbi:MAG: peptide chain release factor-like protein [Lacipirellulaceae bacterium]